MVAHSKVNVHNIIVERINRVTNGSQIESEQSKRGINNRLLYSYSALIIRPCPGSTVWDDASKACMLDSSTCPEGT